MVQRDRPDGRAELVLAANRGPVSFNRDDAGNLVATRGGGGLVSIAPLLAGTGATWVAAAMSDGDREVAAGGPRDIDGYRVRLVDFAPDVYAAAYDVISNGTLWFMNHGLFDLPRRPHLDSKWREAWAGYRTFNEQFAETLAGEAGEGATVLVQDYHLALCGRHLAKLRPDTRLVHFLHTPFANPGELRVLPDDVAEELLGAMAEFAACGFHSRRWADAFEANYRDRPGLGTPRTFVAPLAPDPDAMFALADSEDGREASRVLDELVGERRLLLRVDRLELSKNLLRGFHAYDELLRTRRQWRGQVVFVALVYPSRENLAAYIAYRSEVEALVTRINDRWGTEDWRPIVLETSDDPARSAAAYRRYDVLLVNPVRDGLNLVAKEGVIANRHDGVLALSREAGVWDELGADAIEVHPFDIAGTADALARALELDGTERARRSSALKFAALRRAPRDWLDDNLRAAAT